MTATESWQAWLALEHEAVWLYPVVGARFDPLVARATASFEAHRDTRDELVGRLRALGAEPVTARLTYDVGTSQTAAQARTTAQTLEAQISAATLALVGVTQDDDRTYALRNLRRAALAEQTWGAEPKAFPGLP